MAGSSIDDPSLKLFKIQLVKESLLPNNRIIGPDYCEFSELPANLVMSKAASYTDEQILGRTEPWKSYANSDTTRIEFTARLMALGGYVDSSAPVQAAGFALGLTGRFVPQTQPFLGIAGNAFSLPFGGNTDQEKLITITFEEVHQKVAWLEALTYAQYDDQGHAYPPPLVKLVYGQNFTRRGVVRAVSFQFRGPWEVSTLMCMLVECSISFEEVNQSPKGYIDVRNRTPPQVNLVLGESSFEKTKRTVVDYSRSIFGI